MTRPVAAITLALRFFLAVIRSGVQTTLTILRPDPGMQPGFIDYEFEPMTETGATLLGSLITLTYGGFLIVFNILTDLLRGWMDPRVRNA